VKILAIRLARFGDIVLLLPALNALKAQMPGSSLTFLTDERWGDLASMCPAVDEVITMDRLGMRDGSTWGAVRGIWRMTQGLRRRKFDLAIDCHGFRETNLIAWRSGATRRLGLKRFDQSFLNFCFNLPPVKEDKSLHVSQMFLRLVQGIAPSASLSAVTSPALVIPPAALAWAKENLPASPYAVLNIDAPVPERVWPEDRFAALAQQIVRDLGTSVVVISGSRRVSQNFGEGVRTLSGLSIPNLAATIGSARMLVSNDTGPMHLGPALRVPTLGLFSVGIPQHFCPTGPHDRIVYKNPIEQITVGEVVDAVKGLWAATR